MALREVLADLRVRVGGLGQLRQANSGVAQMVGGLRTAGAALAGAAIVQSARAALTGVVEFTTEMIDLGDETAKTARTLGIGADDLMRWRFAAERSGIPARSLTNGLRRLQRNLVEAGEGSSTAVRAFNALGISWNDTAGRAREIEDVIPEIADSIRGMSSDTEKAARLQQIFGRSGAELLPLLDQGSDGIRQLTERFNELNGTLGTDFFESTEAAQDAITDWNAATTGIKAQLAAGFLPILTRVISTVAEWSAAIGRVVRRSSIMQVALGALAVVGGLLALTLAFILAQVVLLMAPFILLGLFIEDLVTTFRGGDSVIRRFIDGLFGVGSTQSIVEGLTDAWEGFVDILERGARLLGITPSAPAGRSAEATARMRDASKAESEADGAEGRGGGRRSARARAQRDRDATARALEESGRSAQLFGMSREDLAAGFAPGALPGGGRGGDTNMQVGDIRPTFNITTPDPEGAGRVVNERMAGIMDSEFARRLAQTAATIPHGSRSGG